MTNEWTPIKTRPTTEEEKKYFEEYADYVCDTMWDCPLPEDGQEVLITTRHGEVTTDTFICDGSYGSYFETYGDDGDVLAWMPFPMPYTDKEPSEDDKIYCDRNLCTQNDYNGIGCDECIVNKEGKG